MFIQLFITNIAILNYNRRNFLLLWFEKKLEGFACKESQENILCKFQMLKSKICLEISRKNRPN